LDTHKRTKITTGKLPISLERVRERHTYRNISQFLFATSRALQESADRLLASFEALGPEGGYLSTQKARDVLVKTGLGKDHLRQIWNLSDIDRDGLFDHDEYVVAMFLCDAVIQKGRPIPAELPTSVIPPSKRSMLKKAGP
jgi:hypothetical protein